MVNKKVHFESFPNIICRVYIIYKLVFILDINAIRIKRISNNGRSNI